MSSKTLLEKTRKLNQLIQHIDFNVLSSNTTISEQAISELLNTILDSNVLILSQKGDILGKALKDSNYFVNPMVNEQLNSITETKENLKLSYFGINNSLPNYNISVIPIYCSRIRQGTLLFYSSKRIYSMEDIILGEYVSNIMTLEILRLKNEMDAELYRKNSIVKSAIDTLTYSELEAVLHIFDELDNNEGLIIASKVADKAGITRSVIVNALRKFESAGIIESRSLGMKGTYIKILNDVLLEGLKKLKNN